MKSRISAKRLLLAGAGLVLATGLASASTAPQARQEFVVFFNPGSAALAPEAVQIVDAVATRIHKSRPAQVIVGAGSTPGGNVKFAAARFRTVQNELMAQGVNPSLIVRASLPDAGLEPGSVADQRVEITLLAHPEKLALR